jgi:hypothetical protein
VASRSTFEEVEPSGRLAQLLDYWRGLRTGENLPLRSDIDLMEISPAALPHVFLVDVMEDGQRFRWRLIGAHIVRHAGTDDTGLDLDISIAPEMRPIILGHYRRVVRERQPLCHRGEFPGRDGGIYRYERLLMPVLANDGRSVDTVFGGATFAARARPA